MKRKLWILLTLAALLAAVWCGAAMADTINGLDYNPDQEQPNKAATVP